MILLVFLPVLKVSGKVNLVEVSWLLKTENIDQIVRNLLTQNIAQWAFHLSQELYDINFQTILRLLSPLAMNE